MAERYAADGYKIMQSVEIYGMEIVIAENQGAEQPFMMTQRFLDESFGARYYHVPVYSNDYLEILQRFIKCQSACTENYSSDIAFRNKMLGGNRPLKAGDCVPNGMDTDLKGQVIALRSDILLPEYRACSHQLLLATGGFGCSPTARGRAVYGTNLYSGKDERWDRGDILGVVAENTLPGWAHEKLAKLREPREPREKESVIAKIREAKENPAPARKEPRRDKPRDPEL